MTHYIRYDMDEAPLSHLPKPPSRQLWADNSCPSCVYYQRTYYQNINPPPSPRSTQRQEALRALRSARHTEQTRRKDVLQVEGNLRRWPRKRSAWLVSWIVAGVLVLASLTLAFTLSVWFLLSIPVSGIGWSLIVPLTPCRRKDLRRLYQKYLTALEEHETALIFLHTAEMELPEDVVWSELKREPLPEPPRPMPLVLTPQGVATAQRVGLVPVPAVDTR